MRTWLWPFRDTQQRTIELSGFLEKLGRSREDAEAASEVRVADSGVGIASEDLERVFLRYERAYATDRHPEGNGLGLAVSREIVELHGGQLWAESCGLGKGATFVMRIPVSASAR